jgi:hypothetical protein
MKWEKKVFRIDQVAKHLLADESCSTCYFRSGRKCANHQRMLTEGPEWKGSLPKERYCQFYNATMNKIIEDLVTQSKSTKEEL